LRFRCSTEGWLADDTLRPAERPRPSQHRRGRGRSKRAETHGLPPSRAFSATRRSTPCLGRPGVLPPLGPAVGTPGCNLSVPGRGNTASRLLLSKLGCQAIVTWVA